jgi:DNA-binding winged helix-turn-helix (wHTH) protein/TolB-like protein
MQRDNGRGHEEGSGTKHGSFPPRPRRLQFGEFHFNPETLELSGSDGRKVRLQPQPARLLELLIAHRGAVVSREAVRRHLWPDEVHVEYDQSMNSCVKRIRIALGDSADAPEYIETLPRLGYRFLKPVSEVSDGNEPLLTRGGARHWRPGIGAVLAALGVALGVLASVLVWSALDDGPPAGSESSRQVLAILLFAAVEPWSGAEPFRQGLAQELITSLGRQSSGRLAVVGYEFRPFPGAGDSQGLGADFLLDGRIQRHQDRVRVWARLVRASDGTVLWTEAYDGAESDLPVFGADVGSQIANAVVARLAQEVPPS